jgi:hypothetical protein
LNVALDLLEERHTLFGGGIETVAFEHPETRKRSALAHTIAAGETVATAVRAARESVTVALRAVILCRPSWRSESAFVRTDPLDRHRVSSADSGFLLHFHQICWSACRKSVVLRQNYSTASVTCPGKLFWSSSLVILA